MTSQFFVELETRGYLNRLGEEEETFGSNRKMLRKGRERKRLCVMPRWGRSFFTRLLHRDARAGIRVEAERVDPLVSSKDTNMSVKPASLKLSRDRLDPVRVTFLLAAHGLAGLGLFSFSWQAFAVFAALYIVTGMGITFGFHRLFTHRSFKVPKFLEILAALAGTLAMQGNIFRWVAHHRMHHAFSGQARDPHNASRGFWYSHMLWVLYVQKERDKIETLRPFARDIAADRLLMLMASDSFMVVLQVALAAALWAMGGWEIMLWGIFVRMVAVYHATWFVNSAAHKWGYRNYQDGDEATNCWWVSLLTFGEGWHNNHHAHSQAAPAGRKWWEFDATWQLIKLLRLLGLAHDIKLAPALALDPLAMPSPAFRKTA